MISLHGVMASQTDWGSRAIPAADVTGLVEIAKIKDNRDHMIVTRARLQGQRAIEEPSSELMATALANEPDDPRTYPVS
jgi:hypothetical protein